MQGEQQIKMFYLNFHIYGAQLLGKKIGITEQCRVQCMPNTKIKMRYLQNFVSFIVANLTKCKKNLELVDKERKELVRFLYQTRSIIKHWNRQLRKWQSWESETINVQCMGFSELQVAYITWIKFPRTVVFSGMWNGVD